MMLIFHGKSSSSNADIMTSTMTDGIGMVSVVDYAYDELDYIDKEHIGILGHSMGGMAVWTTLMYYQTQEITKVQAGMPMGFLMFSNDETFQMIDANVGIDYAKYDEGGYANAEGTGILTPSSPEVLVRNNSIYPEEKKVHLRRNWKILRKCRRPHIACCLQSVRNPPGYAFFIGERLLCSRFLFCLL